MISVGTEEVWWMWWTEWGTQKQRAMLQKYIPNQFILMAFSETIHFVLVFLNWTLNWYEWSVPSPVQHGEGHRLRNLLPVHPAALIAYQERLLHQVRASFHFYFFWPDDIMVLCYMLMHFDGLAMLQVLKIHKKREIFLRLKQLF